MPLVQTTAGGTGSQTFSSNNVAGNLLVCTVYLGNSPQQGVSASISDTQNNVWLPFTGLLSGTFLGHVVGGQGGGELVGATLFYCLSCKGGPNTVTVVNSLGGYVYYSVQERNGATNGWCFDGRSVGAGYNYPSGSVPMSMNTSADDVEIIALGCDGSTAEAIPTAGWTTVVAFGGYCVAEQNTSAHGTYSATPNGGFTVGQLLAGFIKLSPIVIACGAPTAPMTDVPYTYRAAVSGGVLSYTVALIAGSLPPGLVLSLSGGTNGLLTNILISGTPLKPGPFDPVVRVADACGQHKDCTVIFSGAGSVAGQDISKACGPAVKVEFTTITDYSEDESALGFGFGAVEFSWPWIPNSYIGGLDLQPDESILSIDGGSCGSTLPLTTDCATCGGKTPTTFKRFTPGLLSPGVVGWYNQVCTWDLTTVLMNPVGSPTTGFGGDIEAFVSAFSAAAGNPGALFWDSGHDFVDPEADILTVVDLYLTVTFRNGGKVIVRPEAYTINNGSHGLVEGQLTGSIIWQMKKSGVITAAYEAFGGFSVVDVLAVPTNCGVFPQYIKRANLLGH